MSQAVLELQTLVKAFGGLTATNAVSLEVRKGEIHALIGPNGAGKSTLINQICGELTPDSGRILFEGRDVTAASVTTRVRLGLGRTFQITSLLDEMTVLENVAMALHARQGHTLRIWDRFTALRGLWEAARGHLQRSGLGARADVQVCDLSHGEKKELELVVALALAPKLLLLDEPMAGLGTLESREMIGRLQALRQQSAILLVEHDMEAVFALADRISVLVYGEVMATGTAGEIRHNRLVREAYLGSEAETC